MEALIPIIIMLIIFSAIGIGFYVSHWMEKKRKEQIESFANEIGLDYSPEGEHDLLERCSSFKLFSQGYDRKISNLIQGDAGDVKMAIFDYQYTVGSGKEKSTRKSTAVVIDSHQLNCPEFLIRPESFFDRIGGMLGFQDIDFDSHPTFSKMFVLQGVDEELIRKFMRPELLTYLESMPGISVEGIGNLLVVYRAAQRVKPDEMKQYFAQAYEMFGIITGN